MDATIKIPNSMVPTSMLRGFCRRITLVRLWTAVFLLAAGSSAAAQGDVEILFDPMQCWPSDEFLLFESTFRRSRPARRWRSPAGS